MKYLVSFFVIIVVVFCNSVPRAENIIVFIDMDKVMNQSIAGKSLISQLEKINNKNNNDFKKIEDELRDEESSLISQKNILSNENYTKKVNDLRIKVNNYNKEKQEIISLLTKKRNIASAKLLKEIEPILSEYSKNNNISIILQKKEVVLGKTNLDITNNIIEIANKKIKSINLD